MVMKSRWLIGIDEAGRGPLAGPVSVGVACVQEGFDWGIIPEVDDSKKLSEKKREEIYHRAVLLKEEKKLSFAVAMVEASSIDKIGIVPSVERGMHRALQKLQEEILFDVSECSVKLDGSLRAPQEFLHQETIIGGDAKEKIIGLASIVAKVTRDRHMTKLAHMQEYAPYEFHIHKGYGTPKHRERIRLLGVSDVHRMSYCQKLLGR